MEELGWKKNQATVDRAMKLADERLAPIRRIARGYAGWLLTNRQFLDEHDAIVERWKEMARRWGFYRLGIQPIEQQFSPGDDSMIDPQWPDYSREFEEFFIRWRLLGLKAPYLPVPLQPLMAGQFPVSVLPQLTRAGGVFCLPDTYPIPSRDELRNLLEGAIHGSPSPAHLITWSRIIASKNTSKTPIAKFGRIFVLQHYYRILHCRHSNALRRRIKDLIGVLAKFFSTTERTIVGDLRTIRKSLGAKWLDRGHSSTIGPF